jgi:hypothetical protein
VEAAVVSALSHLEGHVVGSRATETSEDDDVGALLDVLGEALVLGEE